VTHQKKAVLKEETTPGGVSGDNEVEEEYRATPCEEGSRNWEGERIMLTGKPLRIRSSKGGFWGFEKKRPGPKRTRLFVPGGKLICPARHHKKNGRADLAAEGKKGARRGTPSKDLDHRGLWGGGDRKKAATYRGRDHRITKSELACFGEVPVVEKGNLRLVVRRRRGENSRKKREDTSIRKKESAREKRSE